MKLLGEVENGFGGRGGGGGGGGGGGRGGKRRQASHRNKALVGMAR